MKSKKARIRDAKTGNDKKKSMHYLLMHLLKAMPVIIAVSIITFLMQQMGWLWGFETSFLDTWLLLKKPLSAHNTIIVDITDDDYKQIFKETSPLDPSVLWELINATALGQPELICVDIDTSSSRFREFSPSPDWPPVIWAQGAHLLQNNPGSHLVRSGESLFYPENVLGGVIRKPEILSGIALIPLDTDRSIRQFRKTFNTPDGPADSFLWAIVKEFKKKISGHNTKDVKHNENEKIIINFVANRYDFLRLRAGDVIKVSKSEGWKNQSPVRGKIALIGGTYKAARDEHLTPVGIMAGIEIITNAVEADLQGRSIHHSNEILMLILELLCGIFIVILHHKLNLRAALTFSLVLIPFIALSCSFFTFSSFALWGNFIPILVAVLIHQMYDHAVLYRRMNEALNAKLKNNE